jgi:uncharacterized membrane protein
MNKAVIAPIVAVLALGVQAAFGVHIPENIINETAAFIGNGIILVTAIIGVFKNYNKDKNSTRDASKS